MTDIGFLGDLKTNYESMLNCLTDGIKQNKDVTDPQILSMHRLACQETGVYLRILKKMEDEENKLQENRPKPSSENNKKTPTNGRTATAIKNITATLFTDMMTFYVTIFNGLNFKWLASMPQRIKQEIFTINEKMKNEIAAALLQLSRCFGRVTLPRSLFLLPYLSSKGAKGSVFSALDSFHLSLITFHGLKASPTILSSAGKASGTLANNKAGKRANPFPAFGYVQLVFTKFSAIPKVCAARGPDRCWRLCR